VRPEGLGKFKNLPHQVSNPRPSGLKHSALTTILVKIANNISYTITSNMFLSYTG
jgi:succinate-acetate transporter protein